MRASIVRRCNVQEKTRSASVVFRCVLEPFGDLVTLINYWSLKCVSRRFRF